MCQAPCSALYVYIEPNMEPLQVYYFAGKETKAKRRHLLKTHRNRDDRVFKQKSLGSLPLIKYFPVISCNVSFPLLTYLETL